MIGDNLQIFGSFDSFFRNLGNANQRSINVFEFFDQGFRIRQALNFAPYYLIAGIFQLLYSVRMDFFRYQNFRHFAPLSESFLLLPFQQK